MVIWVGGNSGANGWFKWEENTSRLQTISHHFFHWCLSKIPIVRKYQDDQGSS